MRGGSRGLAGLMVCVRLRDLNTYGLVVGLTPAFRCAETLLSMVLGDEDEDEELCQWLLDSFVRRGWGRWQSFGVVGEASSPARVPAYASTRADSIPSNVCYPPALTL